MPISREVLKEKTRNITNTILNKYSVGWDIEFITEEVVVGNPWGDTSTATKKSYSLTALISKNDDAYAKADNNSNKEFKLCKIFTQDLETNGLPSYPDSLKKTNGVIKIDKGDAFQITNESFEGFNKELVVLEIERIT